MKKGRLKPSFFSSKSSFFVDTVCKMCYNKREIGRKMPAKGDDK